jgi:thiamine-phosphate diphosphorylase
VKLVVITDRALCADPVARIAELAALGEIGFQIREKDLDGGPLAVLARDVIAAAAGAPVWINDRVDIAVALGAGVHLPEAGLSIAAAKSLGARSIGVSRHTAAGALAAAGADLVQLGPIFDSRGKRGVGTELLGVAVPNVVAVGGIDSPERAFAAAAAGAHAVAVIRAIWTAADPVGVARGLIDAVERGRAARA